MMGVESVSVDAALSYAETLEISCHSPTLFLIYKNDLDTNIVSKISKFADDTKLCHGAGNPDDIMEQQEDINTLVE